MRFSVVAAALASSSAVYGHALMNQLYVNGVAQGLPGFGKYIRNVRSNSPVKDVTSKDIICNVDGGATPNSIQVSAGDVITMQWYHNSPEDDIIDHSHKGPVMVYLAPASTNGQGKAWTKIFNQGFTDDWASIQATEKLIAAKGYHSITVPDLEAGDYLLRPEIIALHEGDTDFKKNSARGAQFYMACAQITVLSSGSVKLGAGIDLNTDYTSTDPGILFNLYGGSSFSSYVPPGGPISPIAVAGQLGIGAVPAAGAKPTTKSTSAVASTSAAQTTSVRQSASTRAPVSTTTSKPISTRSPLPTTKFTTVTVKSSSTAAPTPSACGTNGSINTSGTVKKWYQCGGINYNGPTTCEVGSSCVVQNPYYSQCL